MFAECEKLTNIDISEFDTSNVENMSYMFAGTTLSKELDLSGWDVSKVTNYEEFCFSDKITVPKWKTAN